MLESLADYYGVVIMKIYLAGCNGRLWCIRDYLSGRESRLGEREEIIPSKPNELNILESFYYANNNNIAEYIPHLKHFMLDSGAFTFFTQGKRVDWDEYVVSYADYIRKNNVELFFELDIDSLVGYNKVKELRNRLEKEAGKQCIPVWHKIRGKDEFIRMCDEYGYVAIGGIVSKEIIPPEYKYFPWFIKEAHRRNAKIHGLGFTNINALKLYHFDSVDSSSWTSGNRFGKIYTFTGNDLISKNKPPDRRVKSREVAIHNFTEWAKYANYAETYL